MINSMPLLAKTSADAIGSVAGMRELEPAGAVGRRGQYDGSAAPLALLPQSLGMFISGVFSLGLVHGLAAQFGIESRRQNRCGVKSLWCVDNAEHWSNAGWLP
jgi:hypothetical protein